MNLWQVIKFEKGGVNMKASDFEAILIGILFLVGIATSKAFNIIFLILISFAGIHSIFSKRFRNKIDAFFTGFSENEQKK